MRRVLLLAIGTLWWCNPAHAIFEDSLPTPPTNSMEKKFPECKTDAVALLISLRRCRTELEIFLNTVLEPYNTDVQSYLADLKEYDKKLEEARARGKIKKSEYLRLHERVSMSIKDAGRDGRVMRPYFEHAEKYKKLSRWVIGEIGRLERKSLGTRGKEI